MLSAEFTEAYPQHLQNIYSHLSKKYSLKNIPFSSWKYLRLRPVNFPSLRLSQFSALINRCPSLFSALTKDGSLKEISNELDVCASEYWNTHYHFNKSSSFKIKNPLRRLRGQKRINSKENLRESMREASLSSLSKDSNPGSDGRFILSEI